MQLWNLTWRLAAICIVASLFFLAGSASAQAASPEWTAPMSMNNVVHFPLAQADWNDAVFRGPGGYLSWIKLTLIVVVFLIWVLVSDRLNQDVLLFGEKTGMQPELWNAINVGVFVLGFFLAISIPIFWIGYPIYFIGGFMTPIVYFVARRSRIKSSSTIANQIAAEKAMIKSGETGTVVPIIHEALPQDEGADVAFAAAGADQPAKQANLIRARQSIAFPLIKDMVADVLKRRGDTVLMDFTAQATGRKMQVDGSWHALETLDRETGDALLASFKYLGGLNPMDRRSRQKGSFGYKFDDFKGDIEILTQGNQNGERVQLKIIPKKKVEMNLGQLGMWPEMFDKLVNHLNSPGFVVVSAPSSQGLSTSWKAALTASDRVTRDCISFVEAGDREQDFENVGRNDFPAGTSALPVMRKALLAQPDCLVFPHIRDKETLDELTRQVTEEGRTVITHLQSNTASEALLRLYAMAGDRERFAKAVTAVTCQKLVRRLCETCKQQVQVAPKLIQQLGGDPRKQNSLYNHFTGPPPGAVDEKGEPIVIPPCKTCSAFGYIGRVAFFELIEVNDQLRTVLMKQPKLEKIAAAAQQLGNLTLAQQAYRLALVGLTSVGEIQRALKS